MNVLIYLAYIALRLAQAIINSEACFNSDAHNFF